MNNFLKFPVYAALLVLITTFSSCEKVVDITLNDSPTQLVIEGSVTNKTTPHTVRISKTLNYSESNNFPPVTGAIVIINDNHGNRETLAETSPGIYQTSVITGVVGRTYTLEVNVEGKQYEASSIMPGLVSIDTLINDAKLEFEDSARMVIAKFYDPAGISNYYRFELRRNNILIEDIFTLEDLLYNGSYIQYELYPDEPETDADKLQSGDTVKVTVYGIDKNVYTYFWSLGQNAGDGPPTAPANPLSNIKGGALGYFSAHTMNEKTILIR